MRKRILCFLILAIIFLLLCSGCAEVIDQKSELVEATVVDTDYDPSFTTLIRSGNTYIPVHHSEEYDVYVEYNGITAVFDDEDLYNKYKDNIGDTLTCELITKYYDNDTIKQELNYKKGE